MKVFISTHNNARRYPRLAHCPRRIITSILTTAPHRREKLWRNFKKSLSKSDRMKILTSESNPKYLLSDSGDGTL